MGVLIKQTDLAYLINFQILFEIVEVSTDLPLSDDSQLIGVCCIYVVISFVNYHGLEDMCRQQYPYFFFLFLCILKE